MKIGSTDISNCKIGSTQISKVYIGSTLLWEYIDADAAAFIAAAGITDATHISAIDTLVKALKAASLWTKMYAIYPFVGGTATTHKFNLKDPRDLDAAYRLTFSGGMTHDANGITGNGTNAYYNTHFALNTFALNEGGVSIYNRTNIAEPVADIGAIDGSNIGISINSRTTTNIYRTRNANSTLGDVANIDSRGLFTNQRTNGTEYYAYINGSKTTYAIASVSLSAFELYGICLNNVGSPAAYTTRNQAACYIHVNLSDADVTNLTGINLAFQTALSRNV
jgi:hypothetical protein